MLLLHTDRLTLRPVRRSDVADIFNVRGDPEVMRFWDWPADDSIETTRQFVDGIIGDFAEGEAIHWVACTHHDEFVGLHDLSELACDSPDLGFMVPRSAWGQGYGREAAEAVVGEGWRRGYARLKARVHANNRRSARLLVGLGFVPNGEAREIEVRPAHRVLCRSYGLNKLDAA